MQQGQGLGQVQLRVRTAANRRRPHNWISGLENEDNAPGRGAQTLSSSGLRQELVEPGLVDRIPGVRPDVKNTASRLGLVAQQVLAPVGARERHA